MIQKICYNQFYGETNITLPLNEEVCSSFMSVALLDNGIDFVLTSGFQLTETCAISSMTVSEVWIDSNLQGSLVQTIPSQLVHSCSKSHNAIQQCLDSEPVILLGGTIRQVQSFEYSFNSSMQVTIISIGNSKCFFMETKVK